MSGNGEPIDLNSHVGLGDREMGTHDFVFSEPVVIEPLIEQSKADNPLGERAGENIGDMGADNESLEGISLGSVEGLGLRGDVEVGVETGDKSVIMRNELSEVEMGRGEKIDVSEGMSVVRGDEIVKDDNEVVLEGGNGDGSGMFNAFQSDAKRQLAGVADASNEHCAVGSECNVESQEGVCTVRNEVRVAQDGELDIGSVDVKFDQTMKHTVSNESLEHGNITNVPLSINPDGPCDIEGVHSSGSLHGNLGSGSPGSAEDTGQLTDKLFKKEENLRESNELLPVIATDMRPKPTLDCLENHTIKVGGGQAKENQATSHFPKTDIDEANLYDVVIENEMEPRDITDEGDFCDDMIVDSDDSDVEFNVSDLVWGKVRSHPWWPGQICDPSASSKKAMKYFKEDSYLVAFFGDYSFSWKEASMLKPFQEYFGELQKQSNLESFHRAIDYALDEFSRRVEFGLACSCLSNELYSKLQTQTLANAGIRKKSSRKFGGDRHLTASAFYPTELINFVKKVGRMPCDEADRLELVRARAQLLAFNRWKGYSELPEFHLHSVVLNYTEDHLGNENAYKDELHEVKDIAIDVKDDEVALHGKGNLKTKNSSSGKRNHNSGTYIRSSKKAKKLPDLMSKKSHHILNDEHVSAENAASELKFHASSLKDVIVDATCNNPAVKHSKAHLSPESAHESKQTNQTFRVGDRIRRVACKLNESNSIFKHDDGISQTVAGNKGNREPMNMPKKELLSTEYSLHEVLSQLSLAAVNPMEGFGFLNSVVNFFSEFRNFVCMNLTNLGEQETWDQLSYGETGKRKEILASTEETESKFIKDSYWTDRLIQGVAEDQPSLQNQDETVECQIQTPGQKDIPTVEQEGLLSPGMNSTDQQSLEHTEAESENCTKDIYPTALILKFTDLGSVPSETDLNNIFRKYGDLYESKTEVMKKSSRAKVVFKKSSDAETAFSSAGKFSVFGPSLVSYRLKYLPPTKVSPRPIKRRRKGTTSREENNT